MSTDNFSTCAILAVTLFLGGCGIGGLTTKGAAAKILTSAIDSIGAVVLDASLSAAGRVVTNPVHVIAFAGGATGEIVVRVNGVPVHRFCRGQCAAEAGMMPGVPITQVGPLQAYEIKWGEGMAGFRLEPIMIQRAEELLQMSLGSVEKPRNIEPGPVAVPTPWYTIKDYPKKVVK